MICYSIIVSNNIVRSMKKITFIQDVDLERIDIFLARCLNSSRNYGANLIKDEIVYKNNKLVLKPSMIVVLGDTVEIRYEEKKIQEQKNDIINIEIVYEEDDFLIINKPPFISVHKAHGNDTSYTIADWIKDRGIWRDELRNSDITRREGIVHRLDKNTSGLMIIAKNPYSLDLLSKLFSERKIHKTYKAVVVGKPPLKKTIITDIIRDPLNPTRMTWAKGRGRNAITHIEVEKQFDEYALVVCTIETGRTHQIRIHMKYIGHPILGDEVYGNSSYLINRQALHAYSLEFEYKGKLYSFKKQVPEDIEKLIR